MAASDVDGYLATVEEPSRDALGRLRHRILALVPDAEQCLSYGLPAFKVQGRTVAGFAAFRNHLSYLPHSGTVLHTLAEDLRQYVVTKGSLHFTADAPLTDDLVHRLVTTRMRELGLSLRTGAD
ncbi:iron chaperone [Pedococcus sp. 5OH_020]|uniref:iron chaperone n=1 Tax=Pedococcus sp. 5OH_020 TaxID=2989814 RepID=UPI0022EA0D91|nr:DUF1801 domain-containing protein [Pedococcus sp. 5OH_020]